MEDLAAALKNLQALLPESSEKYLLVVALLGRLNDANKARLRNTLSNDDLQREYDRIRADLLDLVQGLEDADFDPAAGSASAASARASAAKQGSVLYRIPHQMPLEKETRCVVRVALDEDAIVENILIDEHVQLKSLYRVSDTMQAEIADPSGGRLFHIRSTSEPIQIIDKQGYTEWRFYVTPHVEGAHPLEVKVSIIEMRDGRPGKKELVLEETVQVVTEAPAPEDAEAPMKAAGYTFQTSAPLAYAYEMRYEQRSLPASRSAAGKGLRTLAFLLAFLVTGVGATWALTPADTWAWWLTPDTPRALQSFIIKYPGSKHRDKAVRELVALEDRALRVIQQNPTPVNIRAFLVDFPESLRLEELERVVDARQDMKQELQPAILQRIAQRNQNLASSVLHPSFYDVDGDGDLDLFIGKSDSPIQFFENVGTDSLPVWKMLDDGAHPQGKPDSARISPPPERSSSTGPAPEQNTTPTDQTKKEAVKEENVSVQTPPGAEEVKKEQPATPPASTVKALKPGMVLVEGGTFKMGSEAGGSDEKPVHEVTLSPYYIGQYEVTFDEYDRFCEATGRKKPDDQGWGRGKRPVIDVSWYDAVAYCNWLSEQEGLEPAYTITATSAALRPGVKGYRLPTEAEWEYAARGGRKSGDQAYSGSDRLDEVAWYSDNSGGKTHPVGGKKANDLGLFDMSGNVWEWCGDWYGDYSSGSFNNPAGPERGTFRVSRGGSWNYGARYCRAAYRNDLTPGARYIYLGFRLALSLQ